ncbi:hypothetical protein [Amycolatopsis japonica]
MESILDRIPDRAAENEKIRQAQQAVLRQAAKGENPVLAELAREVLAGRRTLRDAALSSAYSEALAESAMRFLDAVREVDAADFEQAAKEHPLDELIATLDDEDEPEPPAGSPPARRPEDDTDFDAPIMTAPTTDRGSPAAGTPQRARWQRRWTR